MTGAPHLDGLPADSALTGRGFAATGGGRVLLIACGALAREILALKRLNGWTHLDLVCLPASLHLRPDRITPEVVATVKRRRAQYDDIFVVYADCGTGGRLQRACAELGVAMVPGPHCYAFFQGLDDFEARSEDDPEEITSFYLTDFLVRQFDAFVWRPMGLDRHPELREMIFGNYTRLVYQAQTDDPALDAQARDCARRLGLGYERRLTGYGDLARVLKGVADRPA